MLVGFTKQMLFVWVLLFLSAYGSAQTKPYRVLLVISDQWKDPRSFLVSGGGEFQTIVALFKSWGIPFDILRLDQTIMDPNRFTDFDGHARYGAILWDVPGNSLSSSDQALVTEAVEKLHISLIAVGDRVQQPEIQRLLGIRYKGDYMHSSHQIVKGESFLLRGLGPDLRGQGPDIIAMHRVQIELAGAQAFATSGGMPEITERQISDDTRAIWIGGDIEKMLLYQQLRTALRRAVTEAIGYALVKTWTNDVVLYMDDFGAAQNAWSEHWHYPALTQEQIRRYLIEPLRAHHAILSLNVVPGFVDETRHRIIPTWKQQFTDEFGTQQDNISTKKGLDEGIAAGVFEIESHGWTHMQPDLTSVPGPWWGSELNGERAEGGWYREFYDVRRGKEIPAAEQQFHMQQAKDWLKEEFGIDALDFTAGGSGVSTSADNNTWRLAAEEGYGYELNNLDGAYLGRDLAVESSGSDVAFIGSDDVPLLLSAPPDGHDRGITHDPASFAAVFDKYPDHHFIGLDEYIGYQHADIRTLPSSGQDDLKVALNYDPHYCRALIAKPSDWNLHVSDWLLQKMKSRAILVDGRKAGVLQKEWTPILFSQGAQTHILALN
jgi:hypothetical protein